MVLKSARETGCVCLDEALHKIFAETCYGLRGPPQASEWLKEYKGSFAKKKYLIRYDRRVNLSGKIYWELSMLYPNCE